MPSAPTQPPGRDDPRIGINKIVAALRGLKFVSVEITVHEGRIVQIERKEKYRLSLNVPDAGHGEKT